MALHGDMTDCPYQNRTLTLVETPGNLQRFIGMWVNIAGCYNVPFVFKPETTEY